MYNISDGFNLKQSPNNALHFQKTTLLDDKSEVFSSKRSLQSINLLSHKSAIAKPKTTRMSTTTGSQQPTQREIEEQETEEML